MRIRNEFNEFVCLRSNLSNDNIISVWARSEKVMDFRGLVWKRVRKITFFGLKSGQDLENRAAHPHQDNTKEFLKFFVSFEAVKPQKISCTRAKQVKNLDCVSLNV